MFVPQSAPPFPIVDRLELALEKEIERTGSQTSVVSLKADYIDDAGHIIRRPQFLANLDIPKEDVSARGRSIESSSFSYTFLCSFLLTLFCVVMRENFCKDGS